MIDVTSTQLELWLTQFMWPFFRITAFIVACPLFGHNAIPTKVKIGLGFCLSVIVMPLLPEMPVIPLFSVLSIGIILEQILIGIAIGFALTVTLAAVQAAGEFIAMQMGLGFATFYSPDSRMNSVVLSRILHMITLLMLLAMNVHLFILEVLMSTFQTLPINNIEINSNAFKMLGVYAQTIFKSGLLLALPLMGALLMMNLAMGILNRSAPQLTIFSIGFPLTLTVGVILLMIMMTTLDRSLGELFESHINFLHQLITDIRG